MANVNRTKVLFFLKDLVGKECKFTFIKKDGEPRMISGLLPSFYMDGKTAATQDHFPYILVLEINSGYKHVNLNTLSEIEFNGEKYEIVE